MKRFLEEADLLQYYESFRDILKVTKTSQLKFVVTDDLVQIGMSKPEQRRYKKTYTKNFPNTYLSKIKKFLGANKRHEETSQSSEPESFEVLPFIDNSNVSKHVEYIIHVEDITINKELGMGQFGVVQQGTWTTGNQRVQVAIKCLGHERMTSNSTEFLKEAAVMHSIDHPNLVRLYGVVLHLDSLMLVTELAPLRSLLECLNEIPLRPNFPVPTLCDFAEQICDGMTYLENKRLIHRDLAARNILVFTKDKVKISDFGLSRALGVGKDYYQTNYNVNLKLPVAWCAPECILYLRFTSASDVWAYGVCLWEMFTYGFQPWAAFSGQQILENIDAPNYQRLEEPECCPQAYYKTMLECWSHDPKGRPKFKELSAKLRQIRPEQVQTTVNSQRVDGTRSNYLEYKAGDIITVLSKDKNSLVWYGVHAGGACGIFDPKETKTYIKPPPPCQVVAPHKPSEDLEQMTNPNSPSHLTGSNSASLSYSYTPGGKSAGEEKQSSIDEQQMQNNKMLSLKLAHPSKNSKIKLKKRNKAALPNIPPNVLPKSDSIHEYHEINENAEVDGAGNTTEDSFSQIENTSPTSPKSQSDFSQSLLDEIDTMFRNMESTEENHAAIRQYLAENRAQTLNKIEKKKALRTGTMKPMSAQEQKTLDTAVALANKITTRSMNDLGKDAVKIPPSPSDKTKFNFKLPSRSQPQTSEAEKYAIAKQERRNFSAEANSVPDIQSTLTKESKLAYASLIEQPTITTSLITNMAKGYVDMSKHPKPSLKPANSDQTTKQYVSSSIKPSVNEEMPAPSVSNSPKAINVIPLPPRSTKTKLIDRPRHFRKYPLVLPEAPDEQSHIKLKPSETEAMRKIPSNEHTNIYHNFSSFKNIPTANCQTESDKAQYLNLSEDSECTTDNNKNIGDATIASAKDAQNKKKTGNISKDCTDQVSVEDLLEFSGKKPCSKQRGIESDEVRIMCKVLKHEVSASKCLEALELSDWNVHKAIKAMKVKLSIGERITIEECVQKLASYNGDMLKTLSNLMIKYP